jgi:hypothetical protein
MWRIQHRRTRLKPRFHDGQSITSPFAAVCHVQFSNQCVTKPAVPGFPRWRACCKKRRASQASIAARCSGVFCRRYLDRRTCSSSWNISDNPRRRGRIKRPDMTSARLDLSRRRTVRLSARRAAIHTRNVPRLKLPSPAVRTRRFQSLWHEWTARAELTAPIWDFVRERRKTNIAFLSRRPTSRQGHRPRLLSRPSRRCARGAWAE